MTIRKYTQVNCAYFDTSYALRRGSSLNSYKNYVENINVLIDQIVIKIALKKYLSL
jgi:hypothetical protein